MSRPWLAFLLSLLPSLAVAQTVDDVRWVTNGSVWAVAEQDGITYVGGNFTMVSQATGCGIASTTDNFLPGVYPKVIGQIFTVLPDGAGGWYIGGKFTSVGGQARNNLARLGSDLSLSSWNPNANDEVHALALTGFGTIYVGGRFTSIGGQARSGLAELDVNTGNATTLNLATSGVVRALAVSGSTMYVGGDFTTVGATPRSRLCAISTAVRTLLAWNPGANGPVAALEVATRPGPSTTILVGGSFTTLGGQPRTNLGEVSTAGVTSPFNPAPNGVVLDIHESGGIDYVGGTFTTIASFTRNRAAAFDASGNLQSWNPDVNGTVQAIVASGSVVYLGGLFDQVSGQTRRNAAGVDPTTGAPNGWNPEPNSTVRALAPGGVSQIYMGGDFTGLGGLPRRYLAAFRDIDGGVTEWNPNPTGTVVALAVRTYGPEIYTVYAGGNFTQIGGQPRLRMAALHPTTGVPTSWLADTDNTVYSIALNDTVVVMAGDFTTVNGTPANRLAAIPHGGGAVRTFSGAVSPSSALFSVGLGGNTVHVGGFFGYAAYDLPTRAQSSFQSINAGAAVRTVLASSTSAYLGGDFTMVGGIARSRLAFVSPSGVGTWNPGADATVRSLVRGESNAVVVGGDFLNVGGAPRSGLAQLDPSTGSALPWIANVADNQVWALDTSGPHVRVGGTFHGIGLLPQGNFAAVGPPRFTGCLQAPFGSYTGGRPKALEVFDYDRDGIDDVAVCEDRAAIGNVIILKGTGFTSFVYAQTVPMSSRPRDLAVGDFDRDGFDDLAVSEEGDPMGVGLLSLYRNVSGQFEPWMSMPLPGHSDGLAVGDYDADGILDVAMCLTDSAMTIKRGGLQLLKGGGTNAVWDGTFSLSIKHPFTFDWIGVARKVVAMDANNDGWPDFFFTGVNNGGVSELHLGPDMTQVCASVTQVQPPPGNSNVAIAAGDMNLDGKTDLVTTFGRTLRIRYRSTDSTCSIWYPTAGSFVLPLPSTPRDLAVMDVDHDGFNDVLVTFDSLNTLAVCKGVYVLPNVELAPPVTLASQDVYGIGIGDFVQNGIGDVVASGAICAQVGVWENPNVPGSPQNVQVVTPNGGEGWSQAALTPLPPSEASVTSLGEESLASTPPHELASVQPIQWTKTGLVSSVDVDVSRNDGLSWQPIARNVAGTSMNWIVTPPGTGIARIRVRDSAHRARVDASDAPFAIFAGVTGFEAGPLKSGLRLLGMHPAQGAAKFVLDVASPADVAVVLYDAAGRRVRVLAHGRYPAGTHDLAWDGRNEGGTSCRSGIYFVKARIGGVDTTRKVVML